MKLLEAQSQNIFKLYKLNNTITLKNRIVMAPLTRCFAGPVFVPTNEVVTYYAKRAGSGLIISEATVISPSGHGYPNTPGIYTTEQIKGWKKVTNAVHENGGKMFLQLWHVGRVSHSIYLEGEQPVAPSAVQLEGRVPRSEDLSYPMPRALETAEVEYLIKDFIQGAKNAIEAGFDGVEIHGANGYIIDQFLHKETNKRTDRYGGSIEKRVRFAIEIIERICDVIGSERVSLRLSPAAHFNLSHVEGDEQTFIHLLRQIESYKLVYVHTGILDDSVTYDYLDGLRATEFLRKNYSGIIMANGGYSVESAQSAILSNEADLVSIGRSFIANPDLIERSKAGKPLVDYNEDMLTKLI